MKKVDGSVHGLVILENQPTTDKYNFIVANVRVFLSSVAADLLEDITPCQAAKINKTDYDAYQ
jgi:hypothetical protein